MNHIKSFGDPNLLRKLQIELDLFIEWYLQYVGIASYVVFCLRYKVSKLSDGGIFMIK